MDQLIGAAAAPIPKGEENWATIIMDAVSNVCSYYESGFGFREHKRFNYDKFLRNRREEAHRDWERAGLS